MIPRPIPKTFRAAVMRDLCQPLCIEELSIPDLRFGQVLVRVLYSGVCRSQLMEVRGGRGEDTWLPHLLGHEGTGIVLATGPGVSKVVPGDQVVLGWIEGDGLGASGLQFESGSGQVNAGSVTTFCTHSVVAENRIVVLPEGVPLDAAVLFGCALVTGAGMVLNQVRPAPGSCLVVFGLGGVGLSALMAARVCNLERIIAVDVSEDKLATAIQFGADHVVNPNKEDPVRAVQELTDGRGADYCLEAAGRTDTIEQAFDMVRQRGGRCVFASHPQSGRKIQLDPHDLISGKKIEGSWGGASKPDRDIPRLAQLYSQGQLPLEALIGKRYRLEQVNDALEDLEKPEVFRPLLVMEDE